MPGKTISESLILQDRDLDLFRGLFESRVMTLSHIATIHFDGKWDYGKKRIQQLKAAGYLQARTRKVNEPAILFLTRKGIALLREMGILSEYPAIALPTLEKRALVSDFTIRHELEVMNVKAAFHQAASIARRMSIAEFSTWPLLHEFQVSRRGGVDVTVKPDGFIRIHERRTNDRLSEHTFFLEVDRSTESQDSLIFRASCYIDFYKTGGFAVKCGGVASAFRDYPFRVLIVCKNAERRNNTAERLLRLNQPIFTHVCLTTIAEVQEDPLRAIWIRPLDYREALKGSHFEMLRPQKFRNLERDALVRQRIKPISLINEE